MKKGDVMIFSERLFTGLRVKQTGRIVSLKGLFQTGCIMFDKSATPALREEKLREAVNRGNSVLIDDHHMEVFVTR